MGAYPILDAFLGSNSAICVSALCTSAGRSALVRRPGHGLRAYLGRFVSGVRQRAAETKERETNQKFTDALKVIPPAAE
jgi:hypothetical protein